MQFPTVTTETTSRFADKETEPSWWWRWCRSEHRACVQPQGSHCPEEPPGCGLQEHSGRQTFWKQERVRDGCTLDRGEVGGRWGGQAWRQSSCLGASGREGRDAGLCPPWVLGALKECWTPGWPSLCFVSNSLFFCRKYFSSVGFKLRHVETAVQVRFWSLEWRTLPNSAVSMFRAVFSTQCVQKRRTGYLGAKKWTKGTCS